MALIGSLESGVTALDNFQQGLDIIGNNIANVDTTGFKGSNAEYADSFSNVLQAATDVPGGTSNTMQVGTGVELANTATNFGQGTLTTTGNSTDMGISGNGFFVVRDPNTGEDYVTRDGNFQLDSNGYLETSNGMRVQGVTGGTASYTATDVNGVLTYTQTPTAPSAIGDIQVNFNISVGNGLTNSTGGAFTDAQVNASAPNLQKFTVDQSGNVVLTLSNGDTLTAGQLLLQSFSDPSALVSEGNNVYSNTSAAGPIGGSTLIATNNAPNSNGLGTIQDGTLEQSNVDLTQEMTNLITAQRSFQAASRIITVSDTILEEVVNLKHQ